MLVSYHRSVFYLLNGIMGRAALTLLCARSVVGEYVVHKYHGILGRL